MSCNGLKIENICIKNWKWTKNSKRRIGYCEMIKNRYFKGNTWLSNGPLCFSENTFSFPCKFFFFII